MSWEIEHWNYITLLEVVQKAPYILIHTQLKEIEQKDKLIYQRQLKVLNFYGLMCILVMTMTVEGPMVH